MKNTKEYATIHIVNSQLSEGEKTKTELCEKCKFYEKEAAFYAAYQEPESAGMGKTRVIIKIHGNSVTVRRMGDFKSVMLYETGKIKEAVYGTPFGNIDIKTDTKSIKNEITQNGGSLRIEYTLIVGKDNIESEILLEIKKEKQI